MKQEHDTPRTDGRSLIWGLTVAATTLGVLASGSAATAAGSAQPEALINGVTLLDRNRILDEVARYSWAFDSGNMDEYLKRFWEDGYLEHPDADGTPRRFTGHEAIRNRFGDNFAKRPHQTYGHQHQFNSIVMDPDGSDVMLRAYVIAYRHEFHRTYWPHGPSLRMGTWHARYARRGDAWRIKGLDILMWTDTALGAGTAIANRAQGLPGTK
jgi:hypothetical protein